MVTEQNELVFNLEGSFSVLIRSHKSKGQMQVWDERSLAPSISNEYKNISNLCEKTHCGLPIMHKVPPQVC